MDCSTTNVLSLCSGGGGLDLGVRLALPDARTVCYVEHEAFACEVLASRMEDKALDEAPLWTNLRTFDGKPWSGVVDFIIGGYPCQPFSHAGKRQGGRDPRHLWPDIVRIIEEVQPKAVFFENVPGHLSLGFDTVCEELDAHGFRIEAGIFSAAEVGAPHRRERLFIFGSMADASGGLVLPQTTSRTDNEGGRAPAGPSGERAQEMGHADSKGSQGLVQPHTRGGDERPPWPPGAEDVAGWRRVHEREPSLEPALLRVADGAPDWLVEAMSNRTQRLRLLGNGVVPQTAAKALRQLMS